MKQLISWGLVPESAINFRKDLIVSYDIESLESKENLEGLTNVDAIHKLCSIGVGTNNGDSKCFIREDSSHQAAELIVRDFIDYLDDLNAEYEGHLPSYFFEALDQIELLTSSESALPKSKKMELSSLKLKLENYMILDIWGFNSDLVRKYFSYGQTFFFSTLFLF